MTIEKYQEIIQKTAVYPKEIGLLYTTLGMCGEAGEVAEKIKKLFRDKEGVITDDFRLAICKELGDVLWYVTALSGEIGLTLSEILEMNYNKLIKRRETGTLHGSGDERENGITKS